MPWFSSTHHRRPPVTHAPPPGPPPDWQPAPEQPHTFGLFNEATEDEYEAAIAFCKRYPPDAPHFLPSHVVERIVAEGCATWTLETPAQPAPRFVGHITDPGSGEKREGVVLVETAAECRDVCLLSNLPLLAGLYDPAGTEGAYFEVRVLRMEGVLAIGTACRPHPAWRLPGWERLSAALHLDDMRKFFEDPTGGRDYLPPGMARALAPGDTVGCGLARVGGRVFFTYNGVRLPDAFAGAYVPHGAHDVYVALGVSGACACAVNFGAAPFCWAPANAGRAWRVDAPYTRAHVPGGEGEPPGESQGDAPPSYAEARVSRSWQ